MIFEYAEWAEYRGLTEPSEFRQQFDIIMPAVQNLIENYLGYKLEYATHTELIDGTDAAFVNVSNVPVYTVVGMTADDMAVDLSELVIDKYAGDVKFRGGLLFDYFPGANVFSEGIANIEVTYTAGYTSGISGGIDTIPAQIKFAAWQLLDSKLNNRGMDLRVQARGQGNENVTYRSGLQIDEEIRSLLRPFRKTV